MFKSKKIVSGLVLVMTLCMPLTVYASSGEQESFYDKVKSIIFGEVETVDEDVTLSEFRRQFYAGNNNMSEAITSNITHDASMEGDATQSLEYEDQGVCGTLELEGEIPFGPYDTSTIATVVHQNYGFGEGQTSETTVRVNVKKTADVDTAYNVVGATLVAQGEHCNVWIVNPDEYYSDNAGTFKMTAENLYTTGNVVATDAQTAKIAINSDVIYEKVTAVQEHAGILVDANYSNMPVIGDSDNDGRINLILYDIKSDAQSGVSSYTAGYFYYVDYYTTYTEIPIDAVHMDIGLGHRVDTTTGEIIDSFYGTFAHEFQHSLFYTYFGVYISNRTSYTWVNEGLSGVADLYYSDYSTSSYPDPQNFSVSRISNGTKNSYENGSTYGDYVNWSGSSKNYGISYMMSAMMQERVNGYMNKAYDYFSSNLVESTSDDYTYSRILGAVNYTNKTIPEIWGEVYREALGDSVDTTNLSADEIFEYIYIMFMESYMSAGGQVIDDGMVINTDRIWRNGGSLWSYRNGNKYYISSTSSYTGNAAYEKIESGGAITLEGYPSDVDSIEATHEMAYTLSQTNYDVNSTNVLNINIPKTEGLRAYVALYDTDNANPTYMTLGSLVISVYNNNYDPMLDTADLYPIELGVDNYVSVDNTSVVPHLFVFTYYNDVNTTVSYDWIDTTIDIETVATLDLEETSYNFDNTAKEPSATVKLTDTGELLVEGQDYSISYNDNINAGNAKVTIDGIGDYKGSINTQFEILPISIVNATIMDISDRYSYTGSAITPQFSVTMNGNTLEANTDYTYIYSDNVAITKKGYLTIEGIGNYKESVGAYFEIYN